MIASTPINPNDIEDTQFAHSSPFRSGCTTQLDIAGIRKRKDEEGLICLLVKVREDNKRIIWATVTDMPGAKEVTFYNYPIPGAYIVDHGRVIGRAK